MIYIENKIYGKVWNVKKSEKYIDLQISTSEKNQDGEYTYSTWFPRAIGHAFNSLKDIKEGDRISITKAKLTNEKYTAEDGNKKSFFRFLILEATLEQNNKTEESSKPKSTPATETAPADDSCPW